MTTSNSFLGIPVEGDIVRSDRKDQKPLGELAPLLQAVVDDPFVVEFGWAQYTPYFNDGDPCEFGVCGDMWVRTVEDTEVGDDYQDVLEVNGHPTIGTRRWNGAARKYDEIQLSPEKRATADRCKALDEAIGGGQFLDVLLKAFGDHAEVTVRKDGIKVDFYEHD